MRLYVHPAGRRSLTVTKSAAWIRRRRACACPRDSSRTHRDSDTVSNARGLGNVPSPIACAPVQPSVNGGSKLAPAVCPFSLCVPPRPLLLCDKGYRPNKKGEPFPTRLSESNKCQATPLSLALPAWWLRLLHQTHVAARPGLH